jgi:hypothetical protein
MRLLRPPAVAAAVAACVVAVSGCGGDDPTGEARESLPTATAETELVDGNVDVGGGRELYVRCTGSGSPTVVMEAGDDDTSESYSFAEEEISGVTTTCVYDRANLGRSDPAPGPRGLPQLVGDLDRMLDTAKVPPPYVLVGTSGGGFITAGYAAAHPDEIAGMVFVDTGKPLSNPPRELVEATAPDNPENVEKRDYLQVERDAWAGRKKVGDIPVTVISVKFSEAAIQEAPFAVEQRAMRQNVERQKGWLILSPRAKQIVVKTSHSVEEDDPKLVIDALREVVQATG